MYFFLSLSFIFKKLIINSLFIKVKLPSLKFFFYIINYVLSENLLKIFNYIFS